MQQNYYKVFWLIGLIFFVIPVKAQQYQLNGSATTIGTNCYQLTPDATAQSGSIWYIYKYNLNNPFDIKFDLFLGCKPYSTGADGICFVFQPLSVNAGSSGGGMGFGGITPSLGVEFDTYQNGNYGDPAYCHTAIEKNGDVNHTVTSDLLAGPVQLSPTGAGLPDCAPHQARITWDPTTQTLQVYFDCTLRLSYTGDIINNIFSGNPYVYWGFTAGTGGASNVQQVCIQHTFLNDLRDTAICKGASVQLSVSGGVSYSWTPATGLSSTTISDPVASPTTSTKYYVTITDSCGFQEKDSINITVDNVMDSIATSNVLCNGGNSGNATVYPFNGMGTYSFTWSPGGNTGNIDSNLTAGAYSVTITDTLGCNRTDTATISQPTPLHINAAGFDATCYGSCNGYGVVIPSGGTSPYTYQWSPGGGTTANFSNLCPGNYCIQVTDANGCQSDTCVNVGQPTQITATATATTAHCNLPDGSATVNASGGNPGNNGSGYNYSWSANGQTTQTATNLTPGSYCVIVSDTNQCTDTVCVSVPNTPGVTASIASSTKDSCYGSCNGTATALATGGTAPYSYLWSTSAGSQTTAQATGLCAGIYYVTITDSSGCASDTSVIITQPTQLSVTPSPTVTVCIGQSTTLSAIANGGTPGYSYNWDNGAQIGQNYTVNPSGNTTYTVVAIDTNGCQSAPQTVTVQHDPPLSVSIVPPNSVCPGDSVQLLASAYGGDGQFSFTWGPGNLTGNPVEVTPTATSSYSVTLNDNCGTPQASDSTTVIVNPIPQIDFKSTPDSGCSPLCVTFIDSTSIVSGNIKQWFWNFGDGHWDTSEHPVNCYQSPGMYSVSLTEVTDSGCSNTETINNMVTVYDHPKAAYSITPQPTTLVNPVIHFTDQSTEAVQWLWNFGDASDSTNDTIQNPIHTYPDTGTYCTTLIVVNSFGCTDTAHQCLRIDPEFTFYIPNAFSPNDDGLNDYFSGKGIFIKSYEMFIYDRWGQLIFHSTDINNKWDGRIGNGKNIAPEGVYVYRIFITDVNGNKHKYIGHVSIIK